MSFHIWCLLGLILPVYADLYLNITTESPLVEMCPCNQTNQTLTMKHKHAQEMKESLYNKTSWLQRVKHRATHSRDAFIASMTLSILLCVMVIGVYMSKMWRDKTFQAVQQKQPIRFEQYDPKSEVLVKDLLKSRARSLVKFFSRHGKAPMRRRYETQTATLQMQAFMGNSAMNGSAVNMNPNAPEHYEEQDFVDSTDSASADFHRKLLRSSSSSNCESGSDNLYLDSSSEEDYIFSMNRHTGEWTGDGKLTEDYNSSTFRSKQRTKRSWKGFFSRRKEGNFDKAQSEESHVLLLAEDSTSSEGENDSFMPMG